MISAAFLAHGLTAVCQPPPPTPFLTPFYPTSVVNYSFGTSADGLSTTPVPARGISGNALGAPQNDDGGTINFVSLGFGGSITLAFSQPFGDGEGIDLSISETSFGNPSCGAYPEYADVFVSQDGCNWVQVADNQCHNFDVELPDNISWGLYVRIVDASNPASFKGNDDAYDVDGVTAYYLSSVVPSSGSDVYPVAFSDYIVGNLKGPGATNTNTPATNRKNPNNAIGSPSTSDASGAIVFTSLGLDNPSTSAIEGQITLRFDYTIFDRPGADITVYETTWGDKFTSTNCANYPEIAEFWGSNDGVNWTLLNADPTNEPAEAYKGGPGRLCRDGFLDISSMPETGGARTLRYVRIFDKSIRAGNFPNSADGYDVDGLVAKKGCPTTGSGGKMGYVDQVNTPDEDPGMFFADVFPNPATDYITVSLETAAEEQAYRINVIDVTGRVVMTSSLTAGASAFVNHSMAVSELPSGVYVVVVEGNSYKTMQKMIKR